MPKDAAPYVWGLAYRAVTTMDATVSAHSHRNANARMALEAHQQRLKPTDFSTVRRVGRGGGVVAFPVSLVSVISGVRLVIAVIQ